VEVYAFEDQEENVFKQPAQIIQVAEISKVENAE
jgi:hypothetical protein